MGTSHTLAPLLLNYFNLFYRVVSPNSIKILLLIAGLKIYFKHKILNYLKFKKLLRYVDSEDQNNNRKYSSGFYTNRNIIRCTGRRGHEVLSLSAELNNTHAFSILLQRIEISRW